jgi:hypothetical protein
VTVDEVGELLIVFHFHVANPAEVIQASFQGALQTIKPQASNRTQFLPDHVSLEVLEVTLSKRSEGLLFG